MLQKYDISTTYPSFGGGISDDNFIGTQNSVQDMSGIDVQTEERYAQGSPAYLPHKSTSISGGASWFKNTPYAPFVSNFYTVQRMDSGGGAVLSLTWSDFDGMASYGSGTDQVNYFFSRSNGVKVTNYDGSTVTSTITTGYAGTGAITAIGWNQSNILFSRGNVVYFMTTGSSPSFALATNLRPGTNVKAIYSYSVDSTIVIGENGGSTLIYELNFTGGSYDIVSEITIENYACISAVGSGYNLYWISIEGIHQYQARQSQLIKYLTISSSAQITTEKGGVSVLSGPYIYTLRSIKPGRNSILTKSSLSSNGNIIDKDMVLVNVTGGCDVYRRTTGTSYAQINTITLRPLDGGIYEIPKHDLSYRFGYIFPPFSSYTNSSIRCSIKVEILTDEMERNGNYIQVGDTYTGDSYGYIEIDPSVVSKALENSGYKSEFGYVRTRISLISGDQYGTPLTSYYRKTPKLFDFTISANYVKR